MSATILLPFEEWIWALVFPNARIARSGNIQLLCAVLKTWGVLSVTDLTRWNIIGTLLGAVKPTSRLISSD